MPGVKITFFWYFMRLTCIFIISFKIMSNIICIFIIRENNKVRHKKRIIH